MTLRASIFAAWVLAVSVGCGERRRVTVAPDVHVQFAGQERSPRLNPSARLVAAAGEVRDLLGHPLTVEFDTALAPMTDDELEATFVPLFERLARILVLVHRRSRPEDFVAAQRLTRLIVRYVPDATDDESRHRLESIGSGTIVVSCVTLDDINVHKIIELLTGTLPNMVHFDYEPVPPSPQAIEASARRSWTKFDVLRNARKKRRGDTPEEARVSARVAVLEESLGHPLTIAVDPALVPESRHEFLEQSAAALDLLARYISATKEDPLFHAFVQKSLQRVVVRYCASAEWNELGFEEASGTLVYDMRRFSDWLPLGRRHRSNVNYLTPELVLWPAFIRGIHARFRDVDDSNLATEELPLYHRYLELLDKPVGGAALLRLEHRTRGTAIHGAVEGSTAKMAAWLIGRPREAEDAALCSDYSAWIAPRLFKPGTIAQRRFQHALFDPDNDSDYSADPCINFPRLDRTVLAISLLERLLSSVVEWRVAPKKTCPFVLDDESHDEDLSYIIDCIEIFDFLTASVERAEQLAVLLSRTNRQDLLIAALVKTARSRRGRDRFMNLLVALERKGGPLYADALRISRDPVHDIVNITAAALLSEAKSRWADRADMRPFFLVLRVEEFVGPWRTRAGDIAQLAQLEGLDALLFARFLDEGPRSVELAVELLPVLKDMPTPFEIVASRLDAYLALGRPAAAHTANKLVRMACERGDKEGLRVIRAVLEKRARSGDRGAAALVRETRFCVSGVVSDRRTPMGAPETVPAGSA